MALEAHPSLNDEIERVCQEGMVSHDDENTMFNFDVISTAQLWQIIIRFFRISRLHPVYVCIPVNVMDCFTTCDSENLAGVMLSPILIFFLSRTFLAIVAVYDSRRNPFKLGHMRVWLGQFRRAVGDIRPAELMRCGPCRWFGSIDSDLICSDQPSVGGGGGLLPGAGAG